MRKTIIGVAAVFLGMAALGAGGEGGEARCQAAAPGVLENAMAQAVWTRELAVRGGRGAPHAEAQVYFTLKHALDSAWTCYTYTAELQLPECWGPKTHSREGLDAGGLSRSALAWDAEPRWLLEAKEAHDTSNRCAAPRGYGRTVYGANVKVRVVSSSNGAPVAWANGANYLLFPVALRVGY